MATTKIWPVKGWLGHVEMYVENEVKTHNPKWSKSQEQILRDVMEYAMDIAKQENSLLDCIDDESYENNTTHLEYFISGINCNPETAREEMIITKKAFQKEDGVVAFHGYQSFAPGEVTPEKAHRIGVEFAEQMWGDRFQVIVATHLDKKHLHNHFVVNSVSFIDGLKWRNTFTNYYGGIRRTSDRLCRENKLSVIEHPGPDKSIPRAAWVAEQQGKTTVRSLLRQDIDRAIVGALTFTQFQKHMKAMGYSIKTDVKHMAIKPPGKGRFIRLRSLGEEYTAEAILARILRQRPCVPAYRRTHKKVRRVIFRPPTRPTWKGLRALYYYYLYKLREAKRAPECAPALFVRAEVRQLERISTHAKYLQSNGFSYAYQLHERKAALKFEVDAFCKERKRLQADIRKPEYSIEGNDNFARVQEINKQLKSLRKEIRLCEDILVRSVSVTESVKKIKALILAQAREDECHTANLTQKRHQDPPKSGTHVNRRGWERS